MKQSFPRRRRHIVIINFSARQTFSFFLLKNGQNKVSVYFFVLFGCANFAFQYIALELSALQPPGRFLGSISPTYWRKAQMRW